jgi:DNA-binding MurR/RpiR family transcriptional regulator
VVRLQAREERNRTEPYRYSVAEAERTAFGRSIGSHLQLELANLTRTFEEFRPDKLNDAAELLREAPRVWFLGLGLEEGLARYGRLLLSRLRHEVLQLGLSNGAWAEELAMTGPRDALVLITLRPRPRILRPILEYAKTTRMNVVTITDKMSALPAQRYSSVVLACHVTSYGFGPSHTAIASVLRLLTVIYATRVGEPAAQRADIIADIHEELDDTE